MRRLVTIMAFLAAMQGPASAQRTGGQAGGGDSFLSRFDPEKEKREPFKIFDNLYYIGIDWVAAYIITTSDGLIMIDALYGEYVDHAMEGIKKLGFDPKDIRYVFTTHGHFDHVGGVKQIHELSGARVGMTEADWEMFESGGGGYATFDTIERDIVLHDGDSITLGDTTIKFYVTPGHTRGVLSSEFTVRDGANRHKAFMFGGVGLNFTGVERCQMYIESVKRLQAMKGLEVNIPNHASMGKVFERAEQVANRRPGEPHPFVAPEEYTEWLASLLVNVEKKLADEQRAEAERHAR